MAVVQMKKVGRPKKETADDFDISNWLEVNSNAKGIQCRADEVTIQLGVSKKGLQYSDQVRLRIGGLVAKQLGIKISDSVCFYSNPDDALLYAMVKKEHGYRLKVDSRSDTCINVGFKFHNKFRFATERAKLLQFTIHKSGYMIFRIEGKPEAVTEVAGDE